MGSPRHTGPGRRFRRPTGCVGPPRPRSGRERGFISPTAHGKDDQPRPARPSAPRTRGQHHPLDLAALRRLVREQAAGPLAGGLGEVRRAVDTLAARMPDDVPVAVKQERNRRLLAVQEEISRAANAAKVGHVFEVMVEGPSKRDPSRLASRTRGNDIVIFPRPAQETHSEPSPQQGVRPVVSPKPTLPPGEIVNVRITGSTPLTLFGEVAAP